MFPSPAALRRPVRRSYKCSVPGCDRQDPTDSVCYLHRRYQDDGTIEFVRRYDMSADELVDHGDDPR